MTKYRVLFYVHLFLATLPAQGKSYAFAERAPRTVLEQTIDRLLPCIVKIHGASGLATIEAYSTGLLVSPEGHVLAMDLVMIQQEKTRVVLADGSVHLAKLLPSEDKLGLRLLKIDAGRPLPFVQPAPRTGLKNGTPVVSLGNCFRLAEYSEKVSATFGVLCARVRTGLRYRMADVDYDGELLLTDAPNNPGHEGGGLFTLDGSWIGLNTKIVESKDTNTQLSAAIPAQDLVPYLDRMLGRAPAPQASPADAPPRRKVFTGITLFEQGGHTSPPAYVEKVAPGSPAAALGLEPDDLIVRIGEHTIRTCREFRQVLGKCEPGQEILLTWKHGGEILRGKLVLGELK